MLAGIDIDTYTWLLTFILLIGVLELRPSSSILRSGGDLLSGSIFIAFGFVLFLGFFSAAILSKFLPPFENQVLSAIQNDRYYCLLVPLTLPVIVVAVYLHWLSMKLFKHA